MKTQAAVEITHLRKTYGDVVAVDDLSLSVAEGEIFGILGPSSRGASSGGNENIRPANTGGTMNTQMSAAPGLELPAPPVTEREAWSVSGVRILVLSIAALLAGVGLLIAGIVLAHGPGPVVMIVVAALLIIASQVGTRGLTPVVAGEARVVQLFGRYRGTIRAPGLHWVNPIAQRRKVSTRIRNLETAMAKVNDLDGNPLEIAAVVWLVEDTAKAIYAVDDFKKFVAIQSETAVRHIASSYAYETQDADSL